MNKIFIVGGANIDISASSNKPLLVHDSNPSKISMSFGGVGRNIAENCALLKENVYFCSVLSNDAFGKSLKDDLLSKNINVDFCDIVDEFNTSMYLAILDENKDMYLGMSDMDILDQLKISTISRMLDYINKDDILVLDTNLSEEIINYICVNSSCTKVMDPISVRKAYKSKEVLKYIDIFKPNKYESESLCGIYINDIESANKSIDYYLGVGIKEIIISLASEGVLVANSKERYWLHHNSVEVVNATGGGDTLLGAYVSKRLEGIEPHEAIKFAISASVSVIEQDAVNRRSLNVKDVEKKIDNMEIKEKKL